MTNAYELYYLLKMTQRAIAGFKPHTSAAYDLSYWIARAELDLDYEHDRGSGNGRAVDPDAWAQIREQVDRRLGRLNNVQPDELGRNIGAIAAHLSLTREEETVFTLAVRAANMGPVYMLCNVLTDEQRMSVVDAVALFTGLPSDRVRKLVSPSGRLTTSGLMYLKEERNSALPIGIPDRLLDALEPPSRGLDDILAKLFDTAGPADVVWDDFDHIGSGREFSLDLLKGAIERGEHGVNILLYGIPGTGKTELCKAFAQKLGASLHAVGETGNDGAEPSRIERLQQLRLAQRLLAQENNSLIMFDEMEDLFPHSGPFGLVGSRSGSKVHMNRLIENNAVPTLWTSNDIDNLDPAFLRRITFSMELCTPPVQVRERIWQRLATKHEVDLPAELCSELAHTMKDAPALADTALRAVRIARGGSAEIKLASEAVARAVYKGHTAFIAPEGRRFDPALANADFDLSLIADRFAEQGPNNVGGLCMSGPPGTGKSHFARYLAERLSLPVLEKRASDLLGKYVGQSEKNIARAFAEARDTGAFLIFDEADSLLRSRDNAAQRWEVSQVNEMLTWMESHPLPFACTTNLMDQLDAATIRRFTLKIGFLPLDLAQRRACFERFFDAEAPNGITRLDRLTPGDFASVKKRVRLLAICDPAAILRELEREHSLKPGTSRPVGFRPLH